MLRGSYFYNALKFDKICYNYTWKKKYPQYNISGEWKGTTKYTKCLDSRGWNIRINCRNRAIQSAVMDMSVCILIQLL